MTTNFKIIREWAKFSDLAIGDKFAIGGSGYAKDSDTTAKESLRGMVTEFAADATVKATRRVPA